MRNRAIPAPPLKDASGLNTPYGGKLVDLIVDGSRAAQMKAMSRDLASLILDERGLCDLEMLATGGFSPLAGFLGKADYERVVAEQRLTDGRLWPIPVTLPVTPGGGVEVGKLLALRDVYGNLLALLHIEEIFAYDKAAEARGVYGTTDANHPSVADLNKLADHYAAGRLEVIRVPPHYDFTELRRTPAELRETFRTLGWTKVVAYHTREPLHRAHEELTRRAAELIGGGLLIHPAVGVPKPGDVDHYTRVRCYRALVENNREAGCVILSLLPQAVRFAGPREVLLQAIIRRNYGCTHLLIGRDQAELVRDLTGTPFEGSSAIREAVANSLAEIGVGLINLPPMAYLPDADRFIPADEIRPGTKTADLSESQIRDDYLARGRPLPTWFTRPAVAEILGETYRPKFRQGLTIWFTGLSGSGKSTVAHALVERLAEFGRNVSLLDGDEIRTHLSRGLGFSKEDRDANIHRVGYVAGLVAQHGGTTLCSVISPYRAPREKARQLSNGNFVEVYCETPIEICEKRDVKGLYARARTAMAEGKPMGFTGVDDPYEPPLDPEVTIDTSKLDVRSCVEVIINKLMMLGYILPSGHIAE